MRSYYKIVWALFIGATSGAVILGIAGRAAMACVALVIGNSLNLSLKGVIEVLLLGTFGRRGWEAIRVL
jgi:hypothetical protein